MAPEGHPGARSPVLPAERQRARVHRQHRPRLAQRKRGPDPVYRTRQSMAEWLCGELPRTLPGRMPEPGAAPCADRSPGGHWGLSSGVQPTQAAQPIGLSQPGGLRQDSKSIPGSGRAPPSLHRGWTFRSEPTTINQRLKLSHPLEQFLRSCQSVHKSNKS